ncbi:hypothetical protein B0H13DRAFT_2093653 [Mycena leptocephala]|nr:hypothetical protein B0H13DRAFT_2093653 [Mycena leptocephala]
MASKPWYHAVLAGLRKLRDIKDHNADKVESLESLMSFGMGSAPNGGTVSHLMCGNRRSRTNSCPERGLNICANCRLIKYCSEKCKNQHWPKHRSRCTHRYLSETWQPTWVAEGRDPTFLYPSNVVTLYRPTVDFWGDLPAMDCLQLSSNEGSNDLEPLPDLKLCFAASGDLRNLIRTINSLPSDYTGYCDVLLNDTNPILANRNLIILFVLLSSGPSLEEAAEFSTHLMYSAALPEAGAQYVKQCVDFIYASGGEFEADLSFQRCLDTRGEGKVYSVQPSAGIKRLLEMFHSNYTLGEALKSMKDTTLAPDQLDFREKYFAGLKPSHRMALQRFRERIWMVPEDANALFGWDVAGVQNSGIKHGASTEDILGCLFFHVKDELREFARRVKELRIDIHGITIGALPAFEDSSFDRILTSNLIDSVGLRACLSDWGPLLKGRTTTAQWGPHAMKVLEEKCNKIPGLEVKMKTVFAQGLRSPALFRIFESLDAFHDNEPAFQEWQKLPDLSSNEFYDLFTIGGANLPVRFLEFEGTDSQSFSDCADFE